MPRENDNSLPSALQDFWRASCVRTQRTLQQSQRSLTNFNKQARRTIKTVQKRTSHLLQHPALRHNAISSRLSDDYLRGGVEFLTAATALSVVAYVTYKGLARYRTADDIPGRLIRRGKTLHGFVVSVRDGDGLRVRHLPFLRRLFNDVALPRGKKLSDSTIAVRLAAVDAPESSQKYGKVARDWLREFAVGREVSVKLHSTDRYRRVVATVYRKHHNPILRTLGIGRKNLSLELSRAGYATLYDRSGAQYGGERMKRLYMAAEASAKRRRIGMWADPKGYISPMDYKQAVRAGTLNKQFNSRIAQKTTNGPIKGTNSIPPGEVEQPESLVMTLYRFAVKSYQYLKRYR